MTAGSPPLRVDLVDTEAAWDAMRPQWQALFDASPTATPVLHFDWMRGWWRHYRPAFPGSRLCILQAWRGDQLVGLLPLYKQRPQAVVGARRLCFLSTGEAEHEETCPDYLDQLHLPGEAEACADAFWTRLRRLQWDLARLPEMPAGSALLAAGRRLPHAHVTDRGVCPVADLSGGFEAYLGRLSANGRQQSRNQLRKAAQAGAQLHLAGPADVDTMFDTLVRLHQQRWVAAGQPGVFGAPRFEHFHRELAHAGVAQGRVVLAVLQVAGQPVAALYGHRHGPVFQFYQSGIALDDAGPLRRPGHLAHLMLMQALAERGVTAYDFLRGNAEYKSRMATREQPLLALEVERPSPRLLATQGAALARRLAARLRRTTGVAAVLAAVLAATVAHWFQEHS